MNKLENNNLIIESNISGAELTRIYSKKFNKEILWKGDPKFWGRHSPILFPIVGRLKDNETIIEDKLYNMSQHGFARDMEFKIVDNDNKSITYKLVSSENTKSYYPYSFELIIKYILLDNGVNINWIVNNIDSKDIYFSIGAHPAFNIDLDENSDLSNYYLEFITKDNVSNIYLDGPYSSKIVSVNSLNTIYLSPELFENDALIYTNVDGINVKSKKENHYINVSFNSFPLVGIWSPYYKDTNSIAPFICVEPWYGLADNVNSDKIYKNKNYINKLSIGESFNVSYSINIKE